MSLQRSDLGQSQSDAHLTDTQRTRADRRKVQTRGVTWQGVLSRLLHDGDDGEVRCTKPGKGKTNYARRHIKLNSTSIVYHQAVAESTATVHLRTARGECHYGLPRPNFTAPDVWCKSPQEPTVRRNIYRISRRKIRG